MDNVIAYVRVSTDNQAKEDKFGIEAQEQQIREYVEARPELKIAKWVYDRGESGAKERPGFDEIVYGDVIENPPYQAVLVAKSDRVARDINVYYYYKMMLRKKGVQLISISEDFGQMGAFATMLEAFTICAAQMERENINKRTSAGRKVKASKGGYSGGRPPTGYDVVKGELVVNEGEANIVKFIFQCREQGMTMADIMFALNDLGYKTKSGKPFLISSIQNILKNEKFYRGEYHYGKLDEWVKGQHKAILLPKKGEGEK